MSYARLAESAAAQTQPGIEAAQNIAHNGSVTFSASGTGSGGSKARTQSNRALRAHKAPE